MRFSFRQLQIDTVLRAKYLQREITEVIRALTASLRMRRASSSIDTPCFAARIRKREGVSSSSFLTLKLAMVDSSALLEPNPAKCWHMTALLARGSGRRASTAARQGERSEGA